MLTSTCWRNDHNGFSHQGPGLIDTAMPLAPDVVRIWLPPDANCTLSIADHCLRSRDHVNLIVVDKQSHLQYLTLEEANEHCAAGASVWEWAGTEASVPGHPDEPDIVLAAAGDVPTQEVLAAAQLLRDHVPYLRVRVVNVVDLMALLPANDHPHGFTDEKFDRLFTTDTDVIFAFHGYPRAVHELLHGRTAPGRFHVRGFNEQGTTTTPFDMVVLNRMSRYHLVLEALRRSRRAAEGGEQLGRLVRGDDRAAPRLRPRAPGGHAGGHRLDLARMSPPRPGSTEPVILAINPGSSSLKAAVRVPELVLEVEFERLDTGLHQAVRQLAELLADKGIRPTAVAHRVVHGGPRHHLTMLVDESLLDDLQAAVPLAPLHLPGDIDSIAAARSIWPDAVHAVCFDTAFHAGLPDLSRRLPVAAELAARGVRRYGFHGLSIQSVLRAVPDLGQAVVAHLGSGCSVTAVPTASRGTRRCR